MKEIFKITGIYMKEIFRIKCKFCGFINRRKDNDILIHCYKCKSARISSNRDEWKYTGNYKNIGIDLMWTSNIFTVHLFEDLKDKCDYVGEIYRSQTIPKFKNEKDIRKFSRKLLKLQAFT